MRANKAPNFLKICVHLPNGNSLTTKALFKISAIKFIYRNNLDCQGDFCIYVFSTLMVDTKYLKQVASLFENSEKEFAYSDYKLFNPLSKKIHKVSLLPTWSPQRILHTNYLGPLIAVNRNKLAVKKNLNYKELVNLIYSGKVEKLTTFGCRLMAKKYVADTEIHFNSVKNILNSGEVMPDINLESDGRVSISHKKFASDLISVVVPTRGTKDPKTNETLILNLAKSINAQEFFDSKIEFITVYDTDVDLSYLDELKNNAFKFNLKLVAYNPPFNFSRKCNLGAQQAKGDVIIFINDDTKFISKNGLIELAGTAMHTNVGAVGAKLYFENDAIQHAGTVVINENLGHAYFKQKRPKGFFGDLTSIHEVSAVTGACFAQRKAVWAEAGGWDELFENSYNDVEYCFRLRDSGFTILQNNQVELYHYESLTRDASYSQSAKKLIEERWKKYLVNDEYFPQYVFSQLNKRRFVILAKRIIKKLRIKL
jgi:GT2 family glycosyltransferase